MIVTVPLHPLSKKIILNEISSYPLKEGLPYVSSRTLLYHHFCYLLAQKFVRLKKARSLLATSLSLYMSDSYLISYEKYSYQIGLYLYKIHMNDLMNFIYAQHLAGVSAVAAIRTFMEIYDIDCLDIDEESVYRAWQRFFRQKKNSVSNFRTKQGEKKTSLFGESLPLLKEDVNILAGKFIKEEIDKFFTSKGAFDKYLLKQLKCYLLSFEGKLSQREIALIFSNSVSTINEHINSFKNHLENIPGFQEAYNKAVYN